jgi:hypothetical protein
MAEETALDRLKLAVPTAEYKDSRFVPYLERFVEEAHEDNEAGPEHGFDMKGTPTPETVAKVRSEFERNFHATMRAADLVTVCRQVAKPTQIVLDLRKGGMAWRREPDKEVHILARDLQHLIEQAQAPG